MLTAYSVQVVYGDAAEALRAALDDGDQEVGARADG
jgi:hypothetical protein